MPINAINIKCFIFYIQELKPVSTKLKSKLYATIISKTLNMKCIMNFLKEYKMNRPYRYAKCPKASQNQRRDGIG